MKTDTGKKILKIQRALNNSAWSKATRPLPYEGKVENSVWSLNCALGKEWNFEYVLPHEKGEEVRLLVPTSLQIGWIK